MTKDLHPSASDRFDLTGKIALVTGASSGIGRHLAGALAGAGAAVALAARRAERCEQAAAEITAEGGRAIALALDVADVSALGEAFDKIEATLGAAPDILLNCAGVLLSKPFLEQSPQEVRSVLETNLLGSFFVAQHAAKRMISRGGGAIVNVASTAGLRPGGHLSSYCASKAGLIHLTRVMALELASRGIRVNALCPGNIETEMHNVLVESGHSESLVKRIPQKRFGHCEDLTGAVLLLVSSAGAYITGSVLAVDGGQLVASI